MKLYTVYPVPKIPEYPLKGVFKPLKGAQDFIKKEKNRNYPYEFDFIYDIQGEELKE